MLESTGSSLRPIFRTLARAPEFLLPLVGLLALGIAIASVAFDTIHARLLRPLPYPDPQRIVALQEVAPDGRPRGVALANLTDWRARLTAFDGMAAGRVQSMAIAGLTTAAQGDGIVQVGLVSSDFFRVLGVPPLSGRTFTDREQQTNEPLVLLSRTLADRLRATGREPIGAGVTMNERAYTVIGELPDALYVMQGRVPDVYVPIDPARYGQSREMRTLAAIARLRADAVSETALVELTSLARAMAIEHPASSRGFTATFESLDDHLRGSQRRPLFLLGAGAALVFGVVALNATSLLLVRGVSRRRDIAVRLALGATVPRIWRDALLEALVIAALALLAGRFGATLLGAAVDLIIPPPAGQAVLAAPLASQGMLSGGLSAVRSGTLPAAIDSASRVAALLTRVSFDLLLGLLLALVLAAPTIFLARRARIAARQGSDRSIGATRTLHAMVAGQLAVMVVLVLAAGLLLRSFDKVLAVDPGFRPDGLVRFGIGLPEARYATDAQLTTAHTRLLDALAQAPDVERAGIAFRLPLGGAPILGSFQLDTQPLPKGQRPAATMNVASPGYFEALGVPLLAGRTFVRDDGLERARVVVVNDAFQRRYFPGGDAVGRRLALDWASDVHPAGSLWQIVGIVRGTPQVALDREPLPEIFLSATQFPLDGGSYVLRPRPGRAITDAAAQALVSTLDPALERVRVRNVTQDLDSSLGARRRTLLIASAFALLALAISAIGLYAIVSFVSLRRRPEFAVRLTLGARPQHIARLVFRTALAITATALVPGLIAFALIGEWMAGQFYGVRWFDAPTWIAVLGVSFFVALFAALPTALRSARVPIVSLLRAG